MRDASGFDAFYQATSRRILQHAYAVCGDLAEAQDVVQEAYTRAWQRWSRISLYEDPEAWVRTVAWRVAANRWRSARRWLTARARLGPPEPDHGPGPDAVTIEAALRRLPMPLRQAVVLHYLCDMPVVEVAAVTGSPVGTIKVRLSRARTALAGLLNDTTEEVRHVH
jgi:RNA polymerase sigma-70 factor (ECF subfamily)